MAQRCGLSHDTVRRIWQAFGLQPHRTATCNLSSDPCCIEKVRDIVGLYLDPPDWVQWVDEKSQIQALDRPVRCRPCARDQWNGALTTAWATARCPGLPRRMPEPAR